MRNDTRNSGRIVTASAVSYILIVKSFAGMKKIKNIFAVINKMAYPTSTIKKVLRYLCIITIKLCYIAFGSQCTLKNNKIKMY